MKLLEPTPSGYATPFWDATRQRRLVLPRCDDCERTFWYPREVCPRCLGPDISWQHSEGRGEVYAVTVLHRPGPGRDPDDGPYAVALVDLDDGVRMLAGVVGCEPHSVEVGARVEVDWVPLSDGRNLPAFRPA